ncbi:hypothetical protein HEK616_40700 [Streptomyces nigrescens]|uniref:Uncharacterized protein n=1 Tax=Streptomyces nigrescens TaxID=1920 RepID=A0ABM7ZW60_STRNI|nr:hypothetical protein [Streptomyces nigrescens]BDM70583.1 hypothetical protein HEK616_40700 [Streptomyces nigrescens]
MSEINAGEPTEVEDVMDRAEYFRAAWALLRDLQNTDTPDVMEVAQVADYLSGEGGWAL